MADGMHIDVFRELARPFPDSAISWRVGSTTKDKAKGMALAYIDARDVMDRLDEVCGPHGWQCEYVPMANGTTCCRIGILSGGQWVWKSNGGSATGDVEKETEREMAEKGGYSDAFKRAAVCWGIGRYLYSLDAPWVELEQRGNSYVMAKNARAMLDRAHAQYVRNNFKNAERPDAGLRETPVRSQATPGDAGQRETPRGNATPQPAPSPELDGEEVDQSKQPEWPVLESEMEAYSNREDLKAWWTTPEKRALKAAKPHLMRAFYRFAYTPRWEELGETQVWEDAGARG